MSKSPEDTWSQIVKYSSVANGTALTLALSTIGKSPIVQLDAAIGKIPVWCFFLGLLASGLHLFFSFYFQIEFSLTEARRKLQKMEEEMKALRNDALTQGTLSKIITDKLTELEQLKLAISELEYNKGNGNLQWLRNAQEVLLWFSHILFFAGVLVVVWSI